MSQGAMDALNPPTDEQLKKKYEDREYQTYLYQRALEENVIICLPTGCGKTFIAVKAVLHYLVEALENDKKIIFLATTVPLVHQQGKYLKDHIGNSYSSSNDMVGIVTGDMKPEDWDGGKWKLIIARHVVFAMTDQILRHAIERGHIRWEKLSLIILDECHNATKNHPMASLMGGYGKEFRENKVPGVNLPRVIGLSATIVIGNSKVEKISEEIIDMERKLCCKAITYHDYEAVLKCATQAHITHLRYPPASDWTISGVNFGIRLSNFLVQIRDDLDKMESFLVSKPKNIPEINENSDSEYKVFWKHASPVKDFIRHIGDIQETLTEMGPFCAHIAVLYKIALFQYLAYKEKRKRKNSTSKISGQQILLNWLESRLDFVSRQLSHFMQLASPEDADESYHVIKFTTPKLKLLVSVLKAHKPITGAGSKDFCGIVFCQKRITAQMLCYYLQDLKKYCPDTFGFLNCSFALGTSGTNNAMVQTTALRLQSDVLENFRQKQLNILVATKVLEEGLDVPSCNFICRFDPILTYPSFIQSMGRARQQGAKFYALVPTIAADTELNKLNEYKNFSEALSGALVKNVDVAERYYCTDDDWNDTELNTKVPPFRPTDGPSMITAGSATQIVYRYCEDLTSDKLSTLSPYAKWRTNGNGQYQVYVCLPPSSCVKYAESGWYMGKSVAKKAAFLEVCKKLYAAGVLHKQTLLPIPRSLPTYLTEFVENLEEVTPEPQGDRKIGSKNRIQWYPKMIPREFMKGSAAENLSIYVIQITLEACYSNDDIKSSLEFDNHDCAFGIVTAADLQKVPDFLLFSRDGNFRIHLQKLDVALSEGILPQIKQFQRLLFSKDPELMCFNHPVFSDATDDSYFIAPLKKTVNGIELATDVMKRLQDGQSVDYNTELSMADRRKREFVAQEFLDALIIPCYSPQYNERQRFCVLSIDPVRTTRSPFDDPSKAASFAEYYKLKHGLVVVHSDPLLKAKAVSKQLNFLVTKYDAWKMSSRERREARHCSSIVSLIPELLRIHPLPATLFVQSKMLPSIVHRIQRLLLAEEVQSSVNDFFQKRQATVVPVVDTQRLEADLRRLNIEMRDKAISSLKPDLIVAKPVVVPATPTIEITQQSMDLFNLKRKLCWIEIEYIHPRNIERKDLQDGYSSTDEEDAENLSRPPSPSTADKIGIQLIPSCEIPCENFDKFNLTPEQPTLLSIVEAMTVANAQDFLDLERFELMGDSVLKLIVTLHIYTHFPNFNEGQLTSLRTKLISNKHLFVVGEKKKLGDYLAGGIFHPESCWLPPGVGIQQYLTEIAVKNRVNYSVFYPTLNRRGAPVEKHLDLASIDNDTLNEVVKDRVANSQREIQEKGHLNTSYTHSRLGDKSVADCLEALIGCYYLSGGLPGALNLMAWIGLRGPTNQQPSQQTEYSPIHNLPRSFTPYPAHPQKYIPSLYVKQTEELLDYTFKNKWLVVEAFTHPSFLDNGDTSAYQRLEFLGDAILDFLITHHIYNKRNVKTAGLLTDLRSALVNNVTFASQAVRYGFHKCLQHFSPKLQEGIDKFVNCQEKANHQVTGLAFQYLTDNDCIVAEDIDVPKALGDIFESLAGAVFVDSGMSLDTVWRVFYRLMKNEIDIFSEDIPRPAIRQLYEKFPCGVKFENVPMPDGKFVVQLNIGGRKMFLGTGTNKKSAKVASAKSAMKFFLEEDKKKKELKSY